MIGMDQYELIRAAHRVYKKSIRQIARETGHHRKTIRKVLAGMESAYRRPQQGSDAALKRLNNSGISFIPDPLTQRQSEILGLLRLSLDEKGSFSYEPQTTDSLPWGFLSCFESRQSTEPDLLG